MPVFSEYTISLKLHHPDQDPAALTEIFGWAAKPAWVAGTPRHDAAGRPLEGIFKSSYAAIGFRHPKVTGVPDAVCGLLSVLEQQRRVVRRWVRSGGRLELWVSVYVVAPAGDTLQSDSLRRCAALGVDLCLLVSPFRMPEYLNEKANAIRRPADLAGRILHGKVSTSRQRKARTA
jgi:hypothetical protein